MPKVVKRRVRSETYDSLADLKKSLKRGGGAASSKIGYIPDDPITVRLLTEPETWVGYHEHYNGPKAEPRYSPCTEGECCANPYDNQKPSFRYLANAYIVDQGKVQALKMPKTLVERLTEFRAKYGTILDRDYELSRSGSGMDTRYSAVPEERSPIKISRFRKDMVDLEQLLEDWADEQDGIEPDEDIEKELRRESRRQGRRYEDDDEDEDEEIPEPPRARKRGTSARLRNHPGGLDEFRPRRKPASTRGVEDDEDDEPPKRPARKIAAKKTAAKKPAPKRTIRRSTR